VAAQDLIISRRGPVSSNSYLDTDSADSTADGASILFNAIRKRWLLMIVIAVAAGGLATVASMQFGRYTAVIDSALIYTGLPSSALTNMIDPLGAATGADMITSVRVLDKLVEKRGLGIPPTRLADLINTSNGRSSSLLNLTMTWDDAEEGIEVLNELMAIFIEEMAVQRKAILNDHLTHLQLSLMRANSRVAVARQTLEALRKQQEQELNKGGAANDQYAKALSSVETAKSRIADRQTDLLSRAEQMEVITKTIEAKDKELRDFERVVKGDYLGATEAVLKSALKGRSPNHSKALQIEKTIAQIRQFTNSKDAPREIDRWRKTLGQILKAESSGLDEETLAKLNDDFASVAHETDSKLAQLTGERRSLQAGRDQMGLSLIPIKNELAALEKSRAEFEQQAQVLSEKITGISATQLDDAIRELDESENQKNTLTVQRDSLQQLADSRIREWTVSVPASAATAQRDSNHMRLFVLVFAFCNLLFSAPVFAAEWHAQTGSPQIQLARSLRVPVLAERILEHFSPKRRKSKVKGALEADNLETIRMLTLRIQQSCHQPGSVVLFTSLDSRFSAAPLMATVAECLAEREERVLLIDAVSPDRALLPVQNLLSVEKDQLHKTPSENGTSGKQNLAAAVNGHEHANSTTPGLSEYLSEDCEAVGELIRPTGCPGVDLISSGRASFPREAMASSCLTELLNTCRRNYTMVLVHGPAADCAADLQMLTARADGVVLVATKASGKDSRIRDAVQDLLDLGAPVIGLVA
jgi:Mrp family chromosome partitioning ATPase